MIRLTKLKLENWKNFAAPLEWELADGLNLFCGPNDAGKTSVVQAIYYALTGKLGIERKAKPTAKDVTAVKKAMVTTGASSATVTLDLEVTGDGGVPRQVQIARTISSAGRDSVNRYEGTGGNLTETNKTTQELLGVPEEVLERFLFLREGEIFEVLYKSQGSFEKVLEVYLGLAPYRDLLAGVVALRKRYEDLRKKAKAKVKAHAEVSAEGAGETPEALSAKINECEQAILALDAQLADINGQLTPKQEELTQKREKLAQVKGMSKAVNAQQQTLAGLEAEVTEIETKLAEFAAQYETPDAQQAVALLKDRLTQQQAELTSLKTDFERVRNEIRTHQDNITNAQALRERIPSLPSTCPTCQQEISEDHKQHVIESLDEQMAGEQEAV